MSVTLGASRSTAERAVLASGAVGALALVGAAFLDRGDLEGQAEGRLLAQAEVAAEIAQSRWDALRAADELPSAAVLQSFRVPRNPGPAKPLLRAVGAAPDPLTRLLVLSAEQSFERGRFGDALGVARDAVESGATGKLLVRAHYVSLRAWSALGDEVMVRHHRERVLESELDPRVAETSMKLLALAVKPMDRQRALAGLLAGDFVLPKPADEVRVEHNGVELQPDPRWEALRRRFASTDPSAEWAQAFRVSERTAESLGRTVRDRREELSGSWLLLREGSGVLAVRAEQDELNIQLVEPSALVRGLLDSRSGFGASLPTDAPDAWRLAKPLAGAPFPLWITHADPWAELRGEQARRRLIRGTFLALAVGVALAAWLAVRAMARARELDALRRTFVASVSHDLRTPTQSVLLLAETLEQGRVATPEARERYVTGIRREAQRMRRLVEDLLDVARLERGEGARVERRTVELESFLDELETAMGERAAQAGASFEFTRGSLPSALNLDADSVHRAVWNLFENALRHGRVPDREADVVVEVSGDAAELVVVVTDSGPGIPARFAARVFEPFERLRAGDGLDADTGTGLGLSIVRALTRAHGGDVELERPESGVPGACFRARFAAGEEGAA